MFKFKNSFTLFVLACVIMNVSGLRCWKCENARSPEDCLLKGYSKQCRFREKTCQTETRLSEERNLIIRTDCKESYACKNNKIQNPRRAWEPIQCNGDVWNSVCRCCCGSDNCNRENLLCGFSDLDIPAEEGVCWDHGPFRNGEINCDKERYSVGTICRFSCVQGYELLPANRTEIECIAGETGPRWSKRKPCCSAHCPPKAKKDVVIVMDSSSSIKEPEWTIVKNFVANVTRKFDVSSDAVQFAVYRFYRKIDKQNQVNFGDFHNDNEGLGQAILDFPKRGGGTYLGQALRYAKDNVLTSEDNRETVKDLIWILTDGRSDDDAQKIAQELRKNGVDIIALGISNRGRKFSKDELVNITGHEDNVLDVKDGTKSLTTDLVDKISGKVCESSCQGE